MLGTTGACMRQDIKLLTGLSLKLPDVVHRRDYKCKVFIPFTLPPLTADTGNKFAKAVNLKGNVTV